MAIRQIEVLDVAQLLADAHHALVGDTLAATEFQALPTKALKSARDRARITRRSKAYDERRRLGRSERNEHLVRDARAQREVEPLERVGARLYQWRDALGRDLGVPQ